MDFIEKKKNTNSKLWILNSFYFGTNSKEGMPLRFMRKGKKDAIKINQARSIDTPGSIDTYLA